MFCDLCYREMDLRWMLFLQCHALLVPHWIYTRQQFVICSQLQLSPTTYSMWETFPGSYKDVLFLREIVLITGTCSSSKFAKCILNNLEFSLNLIQKEQFRSYLYDQHMHTHMHAHKHTDTEWMDANDTLKHTSICFLLYVITMKACVFFWQASGGLQHLSTIKGAFK